jgi:hypothetical protein
VLSGWISFSFQILFGHPSSEAGKSMMPLIFALQIFNPKVPFPCLTYSTLSTIACS